MIAVLSQNINIYYYPVPHVTPLVAIPGMK